MMRANLMAMLVSTALMASPAIAQNAGSGGSSNNAGMNTSSNGTSGQINNNANGGNTNQRVTNESAAGKGAIVTVSPSAVREVQQALNRLGYAAGTINGVWDQATANALVNFQEAHGLEPTGNLNFSSIAALGLWNNVVGDPLGNGNKALAQGASPPPRGGKQAAQVGGSPLPSQRITNEAPGGGRSGSSANGARQ